MREFTRTEYAVESGGNIFMITDDRGTAEEMVAWIVDGMLVQRHVVEADWVPADSDPELEDVVVDAAVYPEWEPGDHVRQRGNPWWAREWIVVEVDQYTTLVTREDRYGNVTMWRHNDTFELVPELEYSDPTGRELVLRNA